jgi:general stress protein 26
MEPKRRPRVTTSQRIFFEEDDMMAEDQNAAADKLWRLTRQIGTAMLTTRDQNVLRSRPMMVRHDSDAPRLWIFVKSGDAVNREVTAEPDVNLSFADPENGDYVSISGQAKVVDDRDQAAALWSPEIGAWYPGDLADPELRLLRIDVSHGEYWDQASGLMTSALETVERHLLNPVPREAENKKVTVPE